MIMTDPSDLLFEVYLHYKTNYPVLVSAMSYAFLLLIGYGLGLLKSACTIRTYKRILNEHLHS